MCGEEELEDIAIFDAAIAANEETTPWEVIVQELELNKPEF